MEKDKTVGEIIREKRKEKKLSQKELGEKCDPPMKDSAIRRIESGRTTPALETRVRLAAALEIPLVDLLLVEENYPFRDTTTPYNIPVGDLSDDEVKQMELFKEFLIYKRRNNG